MYNRYGRSASVLVNIQIEGSVRGKDRDFEDLKPLAMLINSYIVISIAPDYAAGCPLGCAEVARAAGWLNGPRASCNLLCAHVEAS